ncbi:hypothetical protein BGP_5427 [Beggiatoa sp. PS]|nr:hypothetical protein BGP_5427 [Beggiatoa sp. PS]
MVKQPAFPPPTPAQIKKWWGLKEPYTLGEMKPIRLLSGESAYLASVTFKNRGRLFNNGGILIRPKLRKIKEIAVEFRDFKVMDLDNNGVSEIEVHIGGLWHFGTRPAVIGIIHFKDWEAIWLHSTGYEWSDFDDPIDYFCHDSIHYSDILSEGECIKERIKWDYKDLNNDGILELIERKEEKKWYEEQDELPITKQRKILNRKVRKKTTVNYFTLKDMKLVQFKPSETESKVEIEKVEVEYSPPISQTSPPVARRTSTRTTRNKTRIPRDTPTRKTSTTGLSAKNSADVWFNQLPRQQKLASNWWKLVCRAIDDVYYQQIAKIEPRAVGKPAKTSRQKQMWQKVFNATVNDIRRDEVRNKKHNAWSRQKIKAKITATCRKM